MRVGLTMLWLYYLDLFRLIENADLDYTINELMSIAIDETEGLGIKPSLLCHLRIGDDAVVEVRGSNGESVKLIKAVNPVKALEEFYRNENEATCINA